MGAPMLPEKERLALQAEIVQRIKNGADQSELAKLAKVSQPAIHKLLKRGEVGPSVARRLYEALRITHEELLTAHRLRDPAPDADMRVREFIDWIEGAPAIKTLSRRADVTVKDLLRLKRTPPRGGHADADEVYAHIVQLRAGEVGPALERVTSLSELDEQILRRQGKTPRKSR